MTNKEWLEYLANNAPDELAAWFDSEHVETANGTLDGDTAALNAKIAELTAERDNLKANNQQLHTLAGEQAAKIDELTAKLERCENRLGFYRLKLGTCADLSEEIRNVAMGITDEGMA